MDTIAAVATDPPTADEVARAKTRHPAGHGNAHGQLAAGGARPVGNHRGRRLASLLRQLRPDQERDACGSRPRREALFQAVQPHGRRVHSDSRAPDRTDVPASPDLASAAQGLQDRALGLGRRGVRSDARQHREAPGARHAPERHEARDAAEDRRAAAPCRPPSSCGSATRSR